MKKSVLRLPVFPNWFPYNHMLLDGHMALGQYAGVKTRNWDWDYRGQVLFYNSGRTANLAADSYGYHDHPACHGVIVGVGELVKVRELSHKEAWQMVCNFNNIPLSKAKRLGTSNPYAVNAYGWIAPYRNGFFFRNLKQFEKVVQFKWPQGPVKPIFIEVCSGSVLYNQLRKVDAPAA